jgi:hypothetical protein
MLLTSPKIMTVRRDARLNYKVSMEGALLLKQGRFLKRYTGNQHSAIDINGKLWLDANQLKKTIQGAKKIDKPKKKTPVETGVVNNFNNNDEQISDNLSTQQSGLSTNTPDLSTIPKKKNVVNKKEVQRRIMAMINSRYGCRELYFITVSFPPGLSDAMGIKALNTWLTSLRKYRMLHQYLWVAERNSKGTIHFHIATCTYFAVQKANRMMAGTLKNLHKSGEIHFPGYAKYNGVDIAGRRFEKGQKSKKYVTNFVEKKGGKALGWYLTKYVTKNNAEFENLAWHNSRGFSSLFHGITLSYEEFEDRLCYVERLNMVRIYENDWFAWAPWVGGPPPEIEKHLFDINSYTQSLAGIIHPKDEGLEYTQPVREKAVSIYNNNNLPAMRFSNKEYINLSDYPLCKGRYCIIIRRQRLSEFVKEVRKWGQLFVVLYFDVSINASLYHIIDLTGQGLIGHMERWEMLSPAVENQLPLPVYYLDVLQDEADLRYESEAGKIQHKKYLYDMQKDYNDSTIDLFNQFVPGYEYTDIYFNKCWEKFRDLRLKKPALLLSFTAHKAAIEKEIEAFNLGISMQRMGNAIAWFLQTKDENNFIN